MSCFLFSLNSYFVLTVFTTVGFGDITPYTDPEILFGMLFMVMGAVVNSIIVSEVINILMRVDVKNGELRYKIYIEYFK